MKCFVYNCLPYLDDSIIQVTCFIISFFYSDDLNIVGKEALKSPTIIVLQSISPFRFFFNPNGSILIHIIIKVMVRSQTIVSCCVSIFQLDFTFVLEVGP